MGHQVRTVRHQIFIEGNNKRTSLGQFSGGVLTQAVSPEQGCLASAHKEQESSEAGSSESQSVPEGLEVIQKAETTAIDEMTGVPKVVEPPQIDPTSA